MFIIGELINGMYQAIGKAIKEKDKDAIQKCALAQANAGAHALDVNCGPASKNPILDMPWLVSTIQEVTDLPLSLDSSKPEVIEAGLKVARSPAIVNSTTADPAKLAGLVPLAIKYNASLIGLVMSSAGIPRGKEQRVELAAQIVAHCDSSGFPLERLYIDPIVLPLNVSQAQMPDILESLREFKILSEPPVKSIIGLSNVSQGAQNRNLINRIFLTMAQTVGLDAAILNPLDTELMDSVITADLILNRHIYCDAFLEAYRKR